MVVLEKGYSSVIAIPIESKLFENGHVFVEGEITSESINKKTDYVSYRCI